MIQTATSSANAAASIVIPVVEGRYVNINNIYCGYSAAPTNGELRVIENGVTIFSAYIGAGLNRLDFSGLRVSTMDYTVTLTAGGAGITGKLNLDLTYSNRY